MSNLKRIKSIEKRLLENFKPEIVEYIRLDNNKMIVIEPGLKGIQIVFDYSLGIREGLNIREFDIDAIKREFPGYEIADNTERINKIANDLSNAIT
jgi:hypothetical protein